MSKSYRCLSDSFIASTKELSEKLCSLLERVPKKEGHNKALTLCSYLWKDRFKRINYAILVLLHVL